MRGQLAFTIPGNAKTFCVYELTVRQLITLLQGGAFEKLLGGESALAELRDVVLPMATNLTAEELLDLTPGELTLVLEKLREVNAAFFDLARKTGVLEVLAQIRGAFVATCSAWLSSWSKRGMPASLSTAFASSTSPTGSTND
jgi:hypothetical protein